MKKQSGFTLIELVVVIVILGILAATAIPKFVDLQRDARIAALQGVKAALESAVSLVYSQAAIDGVESEAESSVEINGDTVSIKYGYPSEVVFVNDVKSGIAATVELDDSWSWAPNVLGFAELSQLYPDDYSSYACFVRYTLEARAGENTRPTIIADSDGC